MGSLTRFNPYRYKCDLYIEIGTGSGSCLSWAIQSMCFKEYYSVDLDKEFVLKAQQKYPIANIASGRSVDLIEHWLKKLNNNHKILFFLDAHFPGADFNGEKYDVSAPNAVPLEEELLLIKKYRQNCSDYIICDDARIYKQDNYQNGNTEWLQVPGGIDFIYNIFPNSKISIDLSDEGYILIDNR